MATNSKTNNGRTRANTAKAAARSAGAKLPDDHQSASNDVTADIVEFEHLGIIYEIDTDKFDDLETMEMLQLSLTRGLRNLLGVEQAKTLFESLKENDPKGILRISAARDFVDRMQEAVGPLG